MNQRNPRTAVDGLKIKDLIGIPWRVALALQADGWWLRSDIIWFKPNPMPESVTDRPTKSHEYVFLLTKSARYFYDQEAVREESNYPPGCGWDDAPKGKYNGKRGNKQERSIDPEQSFRAIRQTRNLRTVWTIATQPYPEAHFATFPEKLPSICIRAGTSEWGCCPKCGAPWVRVVENNKGGTTGKSWHDHSADMQKGNAKKQSGKEYLETYERGKTLGFRPSCDCPDNRPVPCIVLDPFMGSGTTGKVAQDLHRDYIGIDIGFKDLSDKRTIQPSLI